jgi:hypothetical protein
LPEPLVWTIPPDTFAQSTIWVTWPEAQVRPTVRPAGSVSVVRVVPL